MTVRIAPRRGAGARERPVSGCHATNVPGNVNCIAHLLSQVPCEAVAHPAVQLPERIRHKDYSRRPVPKDMFIRNRY